MKTIYKSTDGKEFDTAKECKAYELRNTSFKFIDKPDDTDLQALLREYTDYIKSDEYHEDNGWEAYIVEIVLKTYIPNFYEVFNKIT